MGDGADDALDRTLDEEEGRMDRLLDDLYYGPAKPKAIDQPRYTVESFCARKAHYGGPLPALSEHGLWDIYGEDPNCDFGGYHSEPFLERVDGTYRQAVAYALTLPKFVTWGTGGSVRPVLGIPVKKL